MFSRCAKPALALALLWSFCSAAFAADWTYTVRPGDDLWRLAAKYCGSTSFATRLARHNGLVSPKALRAGARLKIPVEWLVRQPAEVEVKSVSGDVTDGAGKPFAPRDRIIMGQRLRTGDGFAVVIFADGSTLEIGERSEVLFNVLTSFGDTGMVDTHLRFYSGRGAARVIKQEAASRFRIWTPSGIAAVRGTGFRVGTLDQRSSRVETVTGAVDFDQAGQVTDLPAGFGVIASASGTNKEALLPAPTVAEVDRALWQASESLRWQPLAQAAEYRTTLYRREPRGLRPIASGSQQSTEFALQGLATGDYAFAVRAVAASGLEGFDTQFNLSLAASAPIATAAISLTAGEALSWRPAGAARTAAGAPYAVEIDRAPAFADPRSYTANATNLPLATTVAGEPGVYYWRVRASNSAWSEPQRIEVRPPAVTALEIEPLAWQQATSLQPLALSWPARSGESYTVTVRSSASSAVVFERSGISVGMLEIAGLPAGRYQVQITAHSGLVASRPTMQSVALREPRPWWAPGLLAIPFLILL